MDEYPPEFLTPPMPLVALVGGVRLHAQVAAFLGALQPPAGALSLGGAAEAEAVGGRERRAADAKTAPPVGVLKAAWLRKHAREKPAVLALLLEREHIYGGGEAWEEVCAQVDMVRNVMRGRGMKLVVLMLQASPVGEMNEERFIALRKRAEVEPRCIMTFTYGDPADLKRSLVRMGALVAELLNSFYREEGRRVRARLERKAYSHWELNVRYYFKIAAYAEFRRDWMSALKSYESAYASLQEGWMGQLVSTPVHMQPIQSIVELKTVAELLHVKVLTLLMHSGKETEAVRWFGRHVTFFGNKIGPLEGAFLHWKFMARQFRVFGEVLQQRLAAGQPSAPAITTSLSLPSITERELHPAHYFQLAAAHMLRWRRSFESAFAALDAFGEVEGEDVLRGPPEEVAPSLYIGQAPRLIGRGSSVHDQRPTENEYLKHELLVGKSTTPAHAVIELQSRSHELYKQIHAVRTASQLACEMGREYFHAREYSNAKRLFENVATVYRKEGWAPLLAATLGYLRECARHLNSLKEYLEYSLELAALPSPDDSPGSSPPVVGPEVGPAGPLGELQHAVVFTEVMGLFHGTVSTLPAVDGTVGMTVTAESLVELRVDAQSPLRTAVTVTAAFVEQKVKIGTEVVLQLGLLSHLPQPVQLERAEVQFSDPSLNCVLRNGGGEGEREGEGGRVGEGEGVEGSLELTLRRGQWKRISVRVIAGTSGRTECVKLTLHVSPYATLSCSIVPPSLVDSTPLWMFERSSENVPFLDPILSMAGQPWIEVEEEEALVNLHLKATESALIGEALPVHIELESTGHFVQQGKLRLLVTSSHSSMAPPGSQPLAASPGSDVRAPAEIFVEAQPPHNPKNSIFSRNPEKGENAELAEGVGLEGSEPKFGVVLEIPPVAKGSLWKAVVYVRWREAGRASLTATLSYTVQKETGEGGSEEGGRSSYFHVSQSLNMSSFAAFSATVRYLGPFRKDALLPGGGTRVAGGSNVGGEGEAPTRAAALPLNDTCTMVVCLRSTSIVPVRLLQMVVEEADEKACQVLPISEREDGRGSEGEGRSMQGAALGAQGEKGSGGLVLSEGEAFTRLFRITPLVTSSDLTVGRLRLHWQRHVPEEGRKTDPENPNFDREIQDSLNSTEPVTSYIDLEHVTVESVPVVVSLQCPKYAVLGVPFTLSVIIQNQSPALLNVPFSVQDAPNFVFSGAHNGSQSVLPFTSSPLTYRVVAITSGMLQLPRIHVTVNQYNAKLHPSLQSSKLFVFPSAPNVSLAAS